MAQMHRRLIKLPELHLIVVLSSLCWMALTPPWDEPVTKLGDTEGGKLYRRLLPAKNPPANIAFICVLGSFPWPAFNCVVLVLAV